MLIVLDDNGLEKKAPAATQKGIIPRNANDSFLKQNSLLLTLANPPLPPCFHNSNNKSIEKDKQILAGLSDSALLHIS